MRLLDPPAWPATAAVLGGGRMGAGIAEAFAVGGLAVRLADATPELSRAARDRVIERTRAHVEAGLLADDAVGRAEQVAACADVVQAVGDAQFVIEAVAEKLEVKHEVLLACEHATAEDTVIATNTSSLPLEELAAPLRRGQRFLGMHWFNPPEWTPGVEVVPTPATEPAVVQLVVRFLRALGKFPAVVGPGVGFVANRLQMALLCEAMRCVDDGIATPPEIDEVVRSCFGFRLPFFGPFQIADMAGLDVYAAVLEQHREHFGDRFFVPSALRKLVAEGRTGTSAGAGFYSYTDGEPERIVAERDARYAALAELLERLPPQRFGSTPPSPKNSRA